MDRMAENAADRAAERPAEPAADRAAERPAADRAAKTAVILVNPKSGAADGLYWAEQLRLSIQTRFDRVRICETTGPGHATERARAACAEGVQAVFVIGGDGTVSAVTDGLALSDAARLPVLGVIPAGTFNAVARMLALPPSPRQAIRRLDLDRTEVMDIGRCGDRTFSFMFSLGDIPDAIHNVSDADKTQFGMWAYVFNMARYTVRDSNYPLELTIDGQPVSGSYSHVAAMVSGALGRFVFTQMETRKDDGFLHLFLMKESNFLNKLGVIRDILAGRVEQNENIAYYKAKQIAIASPRESVMTDLQGDPGFPLPVTLSVLPARLRFYSLSPEAVSDSE